MAWVMMSAVVIAPNFTTVGRKVQDVVTHKGEARLAVTECGDGGIDAKAFFNAGHSVGKLVKKLGLGRKTGGRRGRIRTEYTVVLRANCGEDFWMLSEEMKGEYGTCGRGIVACEDEQLDLGHGKIFECSVDASG